MIHIKHTISNSSIEGLGLFTLEVLKEGTLIQSASPGLDITLTEEEFEALSLPEKAEVKHWGYKMKGESFWHIDFDFSRFLNHSDTPDVTQDFSKIDAPLVAKRDIKAGEELTQNYLEFESEEDLQDDLSRKSG